MDFHNDIIEGGAKLDCDTFTIAEITDKLRYDLWIHWLKDKGYILNFSQWQLKQPESWTEDMIRAFGPANLAEDEMTEDEASEEEARGERVEGCSEPVLKKAKKNKK